jgi:predicted TPR repeat methyltransferase
MNRKEMRAPKRYRKAAEAPSEALLEAIRRHQAGELEAAEAAYLRELERTPRQPDALHFLGVLRHQQNRTAEGIALVRRALVIVPGHADAWNNLGNMHKESGRLKEAEQAYRHALALNLDHASAWNNLGVVLGARGQSFEAAGALRRAVQCAPAMIDAYVNLAAALQQCGLVRDAIETLQRAIALSPRHVRAYRHLGRMHYLAGERDEAAGVFKAWAAIEPGHPIATHMLAACSGKDVPNRASDAFVRDTFDAFAGSFDEILLQRLDYHAPDLLFASLTAVCSEPRGGLAVLDAGCGTGLCGPLLRPIASTLTGVDLSPGMLGKARLRGVYDELCEDEITHFLDRRTAAFDVIASADTLCYFGDLAPVARAAYGALRAGGWLGYTVERADDVDYRINPHGRYSHSRDYVAATLAEAGFEDTSIEGAVLRRESGEPVDGWVVRSQKRA